MKLYEILSIMTLQALILLAALWLFGSRSAARDSVEIEKARLNITRELLHTAIVQSKNNGGKK